jgi:ATP-dependent protease ClpP protease subunit
LQIQLIRVVVECQRKGVEMMKFFNFAADVSRTSLGDLLARLRQSLGRKTVIIDSRGGEFESLPAMEEPLAQAEYTSVGWQVHSAAIVPYLLGKRKFALPRATFQLHLGLLEVGPFDAVSITEIEHLVAIEREAARSKNQPPRANASLERLASKARATQEWMLSFVARHSGCDKTTLLNLMYDEVILSAHEARRYGLVDRIITDPEETLYL